MKCLFSTYLWLRAVRSLLMGGLGCGILLNSPAFSQNQPADPELIKCIETYKKKGVKPDAALAECRKTPFQVPTPMVTKTPLRTPGEVIPPWLDLASVVPERQVIVADYARSFNFVNNLRYIESLENVLLGYTVNDLSKDEAYLLIQQANEYSMGTLQRALFPPYGLRRRIFETLGYKYSQFPDLFS